MFSKLAISFLLLTVAFAAPSEDTDSDVEERGVILSEDTWATLMSDRSMGIIGGVVGTVLLAGGLALGYYYFYYLKYVNYGYNTGDYSSGAAGVYSNQQPYAYSAQTGSYPTQYYSAAARSLDTGGSSWNWPQVLFMISLAQDTFEKFDFQSLDCQKKALCELSQKQTDFGETGRKISNTFSHAARRVLYAVEGIPMPTLILTYLKEYREALNQGRTAKKECASIYPTCTFSMKDVIVKYEKRAASVGDKS